MLSPTFPIPSELPEGSSDVEICHEVTKWLRDRQPTAVYLYGKPGIGKSAFSSKLLRTLRKQNPESVPVVYLSFRDEDEWRKSSTALIGSLIYQILSQDPQRFGLVRDLYLAIKSRSIWGFQALWILFRSLLAAPGSGSVYCIVNNIHSCDFLARSRFLSCLTDLLRGGSLSTSLKIVLIGESQQDICDSLKTYPNIQLHNVAFLERSIRAHAEQFVTELIGEKPFRMKSPPRFKICLNGLGKLLIGFSIHSDRWRLRSWPPSSHLSKARSQSSLIKIGCCLILRLT